MNTGSARRARPACSASLVAAVAWLCGCSVLLLLRRAPALAPCPGALVSTANIEGSFVLRQRLRIAGPEVDVGFDVVTQKNGPRLVVVGLTPFGAKAFTIVQEGIDADVRSFLGPAQVVPPLNVLRDLHRIRFRRVRQGAVVEGAVRAHSQGEEIVEDWRGGVLVRRRFLDADGAETAVLEFSPPGTEPMAAAVRVHNVACRYDAVVVTVFEQRLP